jgi:hypothetical protein
MMKQTDVVATLSSILFPLKVFGVICGTVYIHNTILIQILSILYILLLHALYMWFVVVSVVNVANSIDELAFNEKFFVLVMVIGWVLFSYVSSVNNARLQWKFDALEEHINALIVKRMWGCCC